MAISESVLAALAQGQSSLGVGDSTSQEAKKRGGSSGAGGTESQEGTGEKKGLGGLLLVSTWKCS